MFQFKTFGVDGDQIGTSTGFVISTDGFAITNYHCVRGASSGMAIFEGTTDGVGVELWSVAPLHDLALLRLFPDVEYDPLDLFAEVPDVGQGIFAAGYPHGIGFSLTSGIVSSVQPVNLIGSALDIDVSDLDADSEWIMMDTPINPGNSGGPVVTVRGNPVGVSTWYVSSSTVNDMYFASHIKHAISLFEARPGMPVGFEIVAEDIKRVAPIRPLDTPFLQIPQDRHPQAVRRRAAMLGNQVYCRHCRGAGEVTISSTVRRSTTISRQTFKTESCGSCDGIGFRTAQRVAPVVEMFIKELSRIDRSHAAIETELASIQKLTAELLKTNPTGFCELFRGGNIDALGGSSINQGDPVWGYLDVANSVDIAGRRVWIAGGGATGRVLELVDMPVDFAVHQMHAVVGGVYAGSYLSEEGIRVHVVQSGFIGSP